MSEGDPPQTPDLAVRAFIGLFVLGAVLHGFDVMKDGMKSAATWWVVGGGLALFDWYWVSIKTWLGPRFVATANHVATDFRWWAGAVITVFLSASLIDTFRVSPLAELASELWRPAFLIPVILAALGGTGAITYQIIKRQRRLFPSRTVVSAVTSNPSPESKNRAAVMSDYDRDRRKRVIDELVTSITAGKTLQSLKDTGRLAWLFQSAIFTLRSVAAFREELIKVQNSLVEAGNERFSIVNQYPEQRDILRLIERKEQLVAAVDSDPHDLHIWRPVHSYITNPNIPNEALNDVATWTFFKDTAVISKLNARLFGYNDWCEKLRTALIEKRRELEQ